MELIVRDLTLVLKHPGITAYLQEDPTKYMKLTYNFRSPIRKLEIANHLLNLFHSNSLDYKRLGKSTILIFEKASVIVNDSPISKEFDLVHFPEFSIRHEDSNLVSISKSIDNTPISAHLCNEDLIESIINKQEHYSLPPLSINSFVLTHLNMKFNELYERQSSSSDEITSEIFESVQKLTGLKRFVKRCELSSDLSKCSNNFFKEISNMKKIDHKNVAHIYEVIKDSADLYIIFEYLEGGSILKRIQSVKKFTETQAAYCTVQMVAAVSALHRVNIMHGSIKLESFWYDLDPNKNESDLKLIDFGLSEHLQSLNPLKSKVFSGFYTAPESIKGEISYGIDIWALGVILHLMLIGRPPFYSRLQENMFNKILNEDFKSNPNISEEANDLLSKMLNKKPESRISSSDIVNHNWFHLNRNKNLDQSLNTIQTLSRLTNNLNRFSSENSERLIFLYYITSHFFQPSSQIDAKNLFILLDIDKDGYLSEDDIKTSLKMYSLDLSIVALLKLFDFNKDGLISFSDFVMAVFDTSKIDDEVLTKVFNFLDLDKENLIAFPLWNYFPNLIRDDSPQLEPSSGSVKLSLKQFIDFMLSINNQP